MLVRSRAEQRGGVRDGTRKNQEIRLRLTLARKSRAHSTDIQISYIRILRCVLEFVHGACHLKIKMKNDKKSLSKRIFLAIK